MCTRIVLLIRRRCIDLEWIETRTPWKKEFQFRRIVHPRVSLLAYLWLSIEARGRKKPGCRGQTHRQSCSTCYPIASLVLTERVERRVSSGDTRALFVAGSCQRAWYALLPPVRPPLALRHVCACVRIRAHICDQQPSRSGFIELTNRLRTKLTGNYWGKTIRFQWM